MDNKNKAISENGELFKTIVLIVLFVALFVLSLIMDEHTVRLLPDYRIYLYLFGVAAAVIVAFSRQIADFDRRINNRVYPEKNKDALSYREVASLKYTALVLFCVIYFILLCTR